MPVPGEDPRIHIAPAVLRRAPLLEKVVAAGGADSATSNAGRL
jgi:hypothetical protein